MKAPWPFSTHFCKIKWIKVLIPYDAKVKLQSAYTGPMWEVPVVLLITSHVVAMPLERDIASKEKTTENAGHVGSWDSRGLMNLSLVKPSGGLKVYPPAMTHFRM